MGKRNTQELIPSPRRMIRSLRDVGYDFSAAVADLVDNSVEANASEITIEAKFRGEASYVNIFDNGMGMKRAELLEAMRYGTERDYDLVTDLGKFGLGLKTASMSQCRRLYVVSRSVTEAKINGFYWDIDDVVRTNVWAVSELTDEEISKLTSKTLSNHPGTYVIWQKLDRIAESAQPESERTRRIFLGLLSDLEIYLGMVFHRFLQGETNKPLKKIFLNGNLIKPWDPFVRTHEKTVKYESRKIMFKHDERDVQISFQPFILPHQKDFSSKKEHEKAAGRNGWNLQQGFYIYRSNRLIQGGSWSRLRKPDEHTKLARIAIGFNPDIDDAFKLNVSKMQVQIPKNLKPRLREALKPIIKQANEVYRGGRKKSPPKVVTPPEVESLPNPELPETKTAEPETLDTNSSTPYLIDLEKELLAVANSSEKPIIQRVFIRLRKKIREG